MTVEQDFETVGEVLDRTGYDDKAKAALSRIEAEVERLRADQWFYSDMKAAWAERDAFKAENERLRAENSTNLTETVILRQENERLRAERVKMVDEHAEPGAKALARARRESSEVERLRAKLRRGCERDPLHQCPNCRQALEEEK